MLAFEDMAKLARPGAVVDCLSDAALTTLLTTLALVNRPADLLRVLRAMQGDGRPVPLEAVTPLGTAGACFLTSWLPAALDSAKTMRQVQGELSALASGIHNSMASLPRVPPSHCAVDP